MARLRVCHLVGLLLLACSANTLKCPERGGSPGREIVCYTRSTDLDRLENAVCRCTTLIHQGHDLQNLNASEIKSLKDGAKEANPDLRIVMSINDKNGILRSSASTRQEAAGYLSDIINEVDGIELNVTAGSKDRLVSFVKGLKDELLNKSLEKMILLALPTKPEDLAKQFELKELSKYVDLFTLATHYLRDNEEAYRTFHPSRLMGLFDMLNTDSLVDLISGMGAPKHKILISAPASAYRFTLKKVEENTPRSSTLEEKPVTYDLKKLCDEMNDGEWTVERDEDLTAPYAFKNTTWIAFEDETSLKIKGKYVILRDLAGLALRDVENDLKNNCGMSLVQSVNRAFTEMKRKTRDVILSSLEKDLKGTEISYPRHVRSSGFRIVRIVDTAGQIQAVRENTQTAFTCARQGYFVHPKSCNRFYRCVKFNQEIDDYSVFEFDCPAGLAFDERTEVCVWPGSVSSGSACRGSSEIEPVTRGRFRCPSPGYFADPQNCRWFFACYDLGGPEMVPYEFRCPFGLVFDEHRLICEWPWKVPNCNSPGNDGGIFNYGGQGGYVAQGGIIGQGGFVGQGGYNGNGGLNYNQGGRGVSYGGVKGDYDYNAGGLGVDYDGTVYNLGKGTNVGTGYSGQSYNINGAGIGYNGQTYNSAGTNGVSIGYGGQTYNTAGSAGSGIDYNGQTYNTGGGDYDGQVYNTGGAVGVDYDGQTYNSGKGIVSGVGYNGQTYNTGAGAGFDGQTYNTGKGIGSGIGYNGQTYNTATGTGFDGQGYLPPVVSKGPEFGHNIPNIQTGSGADYDEHNYKGSGSTGSGIDYDGQQHIIGSGYDGQVSGRPFAKPDDCDNQKGIGSIDVNKGVTSSVDYDDRGGITAGVGYTGQGTVYANGGFKTTQFNSGTTIGVKDIPAGTGIPTGFTPGPTHFASGSPGFATGNVNTGYIGNTVGITAGVNNYNSYDSTAQSGVYKGVDSTVTAGIGLNRGTGNEGVSTISYGNTGAAHINTGLYEAGNTQYTGGPGPVVYNSTYSASPGYPSSTIIPYVPRENTLNTGDYRGTAPVNSVIYHSHLTMGLSSAENFGTQYTNQAEKSFTSQGQTPAGFAFNGRTQNSQNFNTPSNAYDNSNLNLVGVTPSITLIRDGVYNSGTSGGNTQYSTGAGNFPTSTVAPNYNVGVGVTSNYDNSQIFGSSITSGNNEITKFQDTTNTPGNFRYTVNVGSTYYNQGSSINQNPYTATSFTKTPGPSTIAPVTVTQSYNNQGTIVPGVIPLNTVRPAVELDNSGLFGSNVGGATRTGTNFAASTAAQNTGYRTNEYYDNGGRGTIRYNNGVVANKVTQTDQDYRTPPYARVPNSFIINAGNNENVQSTIQTADNLNTQFPQGTYTREGFTKTGPTRTGITTAQVGGSGSYVIGTGTPRVKPNPQLIGEQAFAGSFGTTGSATNFGASGATTNFGTARTTTNFGATGGFTSVDSGITANSATGSISENTGYSYPRPLVQLEVKGISGTPTSVTQTNYDATTLSSLSKAESLDNQSGNRGFSTTITPIGFTTNQLDDFRTTVYQAAKLPVAVTTVRPVINTGSRTVISSTPIPAVISTQTSTYGPENLSTRPDGYLGVGVSFGDYSNGQGSTSNSDYSDITGNFNQGNFGQRVAGQTRFTNINFQQPTTYAQGVQNNELNTATQTDYNIYTQTGIDATQTGTLRGNQAGNFRSSTVTIPNQVYLPSSTIAPVAGVTFRQPIVAAEFGRGQTSTVTVSQNTNTVNFGSRGTANRILTNQAPTNFVLQKSPNGILFNQASADFTARGSSNGILTNQAASTYATSGATDGTFFGNQASGTFGSRGTSNRILNNQAQANYASRGSANEGFGNQISVDFSSQGSPTAILKNQAPNYGISGNNQGFNGQTRTLVGSNVVTSIGGVDINNDIIRQNGVNTNFGRVQSTTIAPEVTTYNGNFNRVQTRIESNVQNQNKKVIVKLSDLHPLILGKLGAECTCKADPFVVFRGPNRPTLPINSQNRGFVDLSNYDESDIYVDVDNDKESDFVKNIPSSRILKTSNVQLNGNDASVIVQSRGEPLSSTYLPPTTRRPSSTYLPPPQPSNSYLPSSTDVPYSAVLTENQAPLRVRTQNRQPLLIRVEDDNANSASFATTRGRSGKAILNTPVGSVNDFRDTSNVRSNEEASPTGLECARAGLFRHPKFCNKFYACHWDEWKKRFTLHVFNCPVHLAFDSSAGACNYPSKGPACQDNKLLL